MTLAQARALCTSVQYLDHRPEQDRKSLEALGRWMMRFSPIVAIESGKAGEDEAWEGRPHHLFIDVTGCERVFRGLGSLMKQVKEALARMSVAARVAIGPTPGAAWAMGWGEATEGRSDEATKGGTEGTEARRHGGTKGGGGGSSPIANCKLQIANLPLECLRISPDLAESLHRLGLETIGDVLRLPREALPARFGPVLLRRIDQLFGRIPEPLIPLDDPRPLRESIDFEHVVPTLEPIWGVMRKMLARLMRELERRGCGARRVEIELKRSLTPTVRKTILLSRATRDAKKVERLARCAIEGDLQLPICNLQLRKRPIANRKSKIANSVPWFDNDGFVALRISVPLYERMEAEQIALMEGDEFAGRIELDDLVERLRVRLGEEAVGQLELRESHVPGRDFRFAIADSGAAKKRRSDGATKGGEEGTKARRHEGTKGGRGEEGTSAEIPSAFTRYAIRNTQSSPIANCKSQIANPHRPLTLLPAPVELRVMVSPSEDREGRPIAFSHAGQHHRVVHFVGPERIAGQWWDGHNKTRDYFDVEDEKGKRWWMFRVLQTARWYLQGEFD